MKKDSITVQALPGGVTNHNYILKAKDVKLVIRVAGQGTQNYIDRSQENQNALEMSRVGIGPKIYFSEPDTGFQVSEFIEGETMEKERFQTNDCLLQRAAEVLRNCHESKANFQNVFSPLENIRKNLQILEEEGYQKRYENWGEMLEQLQKIEEHWRRETCTLVPCHNDTLAGNFLGDESGLRLIDWEYSGKNDPYYDLACFAMENELDEQKERYFLTCYQKREPKETEWQRFYENKFVASFYWSIWSLVQIAYGKEETFYAAYGEKRAAFAQEAWKKLEELEEKR
ncbi:MAG: phosphotransferase [Lachnospiraceae bacterium]